MTREIVAARQPWFSGRFAFSGNGRAGLRVPAQLAGVAFVALLLTGPAPARAEIGPTSSASVDIHVSVAPKFGLRVNTRQAKDTAASGRYCIETNGKPVALPILLIQSGAGQSADTGQLLPWCGSESSVAGGNSEPSAGGRAPRLFIIRPE